jgi:hypothetical protein
VSWPYIGPYQKLKVKAEGKEKSIESGDRQDGPLQSALTARASVKTKGEILPTLAGTEYMDLGKETWQRAGSSKNLEERFQKVQLQLHHPSACNITTYQSREKFKNIKVTTDLIAGSTLSVQRLSALAYPTMSALMTTHTDPTVRPTRYRNTLKKFSPWSTDKKHVLYMYMLYRTMCIIYTQLK